MNEALDLVEIRLKHPEDFLKIKETLTRIGISVAPKVLEQACHILHKRGRYYVIHYKELMALDGESTAMSDLEWKRRNTIAFLLNKWNLCELVDATKVADRLTHDQITIVSFKDKEGWSLKPNYVVGKKKSNDTQKGGYTDGRG